MGFVKKAIIGLLILNSGCIIKQETQNGIQRIEYDSGRIEFVDRQKYHKTYVDLPGNGHILDFTIDSLGNKTEICNGYGIDQSLSAMNASRKRYEESGIKDSVFIAFDEWYDILGRFDGYEPLSHEPFVADGCFTEQCHKNAVSLKRAKKE